MDWIEGMSSAVRYIEENLTEDLSLENISKQAFISSFYFQKAFSMLCGFTVGEYIRFRRLTLAGSELLATDEKIIDIAIKYGYDSPDSFTKAFTRFHGVTPSSARKGDAMIKSFAPLKIKLSLEGGFIVDYKIIEKENFTVIGALKQIRYDTSIEEIPKFWDEHYQSENNKIVSGMYGICFDDCSNGEVFEYLIADNYLSCREIPRGFTCRTIPKHIWAVFPCIGSLPDSIQEVNKKIFSEWLPNCKDYEIAGKYNVEFYSPIRDYTNGIKDESYYSEIWIPVKKKS